MRHVQMTRLVWLTAALIAIACIVFAVHYIGLTAGESLADRGLVAPWVAM